MFQKERLKVTKRYGFFNLSCILNYFCLVKIRYNSGSHSVWYLEYTYFNFKQLYKKSHHGVVTLVPMIYISDHQIPHHSVKVPVVIVLRHAAKSIPVDGTVQHVTALALHFIIYFPLYCNFHIQDFYWTKSYNVRFTLQLNSFNNLVYIVVFRSQCNKLTDPKQILIYFQCYKMYLLNLCNLCL